MASAPPARTLPAPVARARLGHWWPAACLAAAVALAYGNTLRAPFLFDDTAAVVNNPTIRHLGSLEIFHPPADGGTTTGRPLVNASFALNYALSGEHVWSYHALNLALHALAALTLFGLVRRTVGRVIPNPPPQDDRTAERRVKDNAPYLVAFATALLWSLHPLLTESVTCVAQRTELLCGLFYLLTLYCFVRSVSPPDGGARYSQRGWFALSVLSCLAGMATKEVMVTAPLLVLLYDRTFVARTFSAAWRARRGYYSALAGTWLLLAWLVAQSGGARGVAAGFGLGVSWWAYLLKQCEALVLYLQLSVWPHPLVLDYGQAVAHSITDVWWQGLVVVALLAATVWALVRRPVLGFAGAWFFLILAPSSSVVPLVTQTIAEHRMYLPLAAIVSLVVAAASRRLGALSPWLFAVIGLVFGSATIARNHDYRDAVAIWSDNVTTHPEVARGHHNLAWEFQQQGKSAQANEHFARALALEPGYITAHYSWGVALLDQGRTADAIAQFEAAVRLAPDHADAHLNLGNALMQVQRPAEAIAHYEEALRLKPAADVHYNLGVALMDVERSDEATAHFRAALKENPALPEAHYRLGRLAEAAGQLADAERAYGETLRLAPDHAAAHAKLGVLLARSDRLPAAAEHLRAAVRLAPADADAHANLGNVLLLQNLPREAIAEYEAAVRLRPSDPRTLESLRLARESLH